MSDERRVSAKSAHDFTRRAFLKAGLTEKDAHIIADNLILAELRGISSHGMTRLIYYLKKLEDGGFNAHPDMKIVSERLSTFLIDADKAPGAVAGTFAMQKCIEKAKQTGICMGSVRNSNHFGIAAFYGMMALEHDMIGMAFCNTVANMNVYGGIDKVSGSNPICAAIPTNNDAPFVYDGATSAVAQGKVVVARKEGRKIPMDWALDRNGDPTDDPTEALAGCMMHFGGYKGSDLSMLVDLFCAGLSGAYFNNEAYPLVTMSDTCQNLGFNFVAIDVAAFTDVPAFKQRLTDHFADLRKTRRAKNVDRITLPGEPEYEKTLDNEQNGFRIGAGVLTELSGISKKYDLGDEPLNWQP